MHNWLLARCYHLHGCIIDYLKIHFIIKNNTSRNHRLKSVLDWVKWFGVDVEGPDVQCSASGWSHMHTSLTFQLINLSITQALLSSLVFLLSTKSFLCITENSHYKPPHPPPPKKK